MKESIDQMLADDENLQTFLSWVKQKVSSVQTKYKPDNVRFFYFSINSSPAIYRSPNFDFSLGLDLDLDCSIYCSLDLYSTLNFSLDFSLDFSDDLDRSIYHSICLNLDHSLDRAIKASKGELQQLLQTLKDKLPDSETNGEISSQWWVNNGEEWIFEFRQVCIKHRNIGHDWQFTNEQKELLKKYYDANLLLVQCMNRSYASRQVREEIESTLLLPVGSATKL